LRDRIRGFEGSALPAAEPAGVSTGFAAFDRQLAGGGLRPGTLTEWLAGESGCGAATLALAIAGRLLASGGTFVVIDDTGEFYPVAAADLGVSLERTVVVHPDDPASALWAWEQSLRCPGVAVTFGRIGAVTDRVFRRLQLAAEAGGGHGFLVRQPGCRSGASWAAARLCVTSVPTAEPALALGRRFRVRVIRGQSVAREPVIELELDRDPCPVPVVPELARPVAARRATGG
jgi:hypothetical protein